LSGKERERERERHLDLGWKKSLPKKMYIVEVEV
jgi:hypothetical protein